MTDVAPVAPQAPAPAAPATTKPWQSKTLWVAAVTALVPLVCPPAAAWLAANPELASAALGGLFAALRLVSHGKVTVT